MASGTGTPTNRAGDIDRYAAALSAQDGVARVDTLTGSYVDGRRVPAGGSVVIPLKALVLNLLSLSAVYGAMVPVFQDGHFAGMLGFTGTGTIDTSMPLLLFCIAFGLSTDYEVFLLSRIKEEHDRGADTVTAVASGLERSGRIVTTLAALLAIVFVAFATSQVTFLKLFVLGTALAIVVDATLIRALLVPAFMRLAGRANWWAPRPLRLLHDRVGLREDVRRAPIPEVSRS